MLQRVLQRVSQCVLQIRCSVCAAVCVAVRATGGIYVLLTVADMLQCVVAVRVAVCIAMPYIAGCNRRSFHQVDILKKHLAPKSAK